MTDASPRTRPARDMALYERLIDDSIADADRRGGAVDHLTARRLAIWLAARPQQRDFAHGLDQFTRTGAISRELRMHLRNRARSANYPDRSQAFRLVQYCANRGPDLGPLGPDFGDACDQIDRADAMLAGLRDRIRQGTSQPRQARPDTAAPTVAAHTSRHSGNRTVTLTMDEATASIAIFAITAHAGEREAHVREVEQFGQGLPDGSYGRQNRQAIADRERRAATRLRAVERAYQQAIERDSTATPAPATTLRPGARAADREMELE